MQNMKGGKATDPDNIAIEQIEALEEFGISEITTLLNGIYDTGHTSKDMLKKAGATACELHRTISLMSQRYSSA